MDRGATWPIHTRDITYSYAWHDSFMCVTWLIPVCDMTHSYAWHDSFSPVASSWKNVLGGHAHVFSFWLYESCQTYIWVMSHICMCHVKHMNKSCHTYEWVMSHIWTSHVTHVNESCLSYEWVMSHVWMSHVTHMNASWRTYEWVMSHIWMSHITQMNEIMSKKSRHTHIWIGRLGDKHVSSFWL